MEAVTGFFNDLPSNEVWRSAAISECGRYRWWLRREWGDGGLTCCFVMLNPSTADGTKDDPTVRRCMAFTRHWGFSVLEIRNLFAWRATDPKELSALSPMAACGLPRGDEELRKAAHADLVIAAWGASMPKDPLLRGRADKAMRLLADTPIYCLGLTKGGHPRHPLFVKGDAELVQFTGGKP